VIAAEGEMKASRALKEASDVMIESPAALQVKGSITLMLFFCNLIFPMAYSFQGRWYV
jgi:erythrocyte band 7 integral membrane protein